MSTLGVVIPTKNSRSLLPGHVDALTKWFDVADDVVVVDSESKDGTVEFLQSHLDHPGLRFLSHPPGLYESWNHGLGSLGTDFAYISTIGDSITRDGILHLRTTMENLTADVVLSRPTLVSEGGQHIGDWPLPLDLIVRDHSSSEPFRMSGLEMALYAVRFADGGLLGSSASNLYRTSFMRAHPFPTDYGPAGDGVWAVENVFNCAWSVTPLKFSTFLEHTRSHSPPRCGVRLDAVLKDAYARELEYTKISKEELERLDVFRALELCSTWLDLKEQCDLARRNRWPWVLSPRAWRQRRSRNRHRASLNAWLEMALAKCAR